MTLGAYVGPCAHFVPAGEICQYCHGTGPKNAHPLPEQPQEGERYRRALEEIKQATIDGKVCDDVAWFDKFTTLYDFIDMVLDPPEPPVFRDLFPSTETKESGE